MKEKPLSPRRSTCNLGRWHAIQYGASLYSERFELRRRKREADSHDSGPTPFSRRFGRIEFASIRQLATRQNEESEGNTSLGIDDHLGVRRQRLLVSPRGLARDYQATMSLAPRFPLFALMQAAMSTSLVNVAAAICQWCR